MGNSSFKRIHEKGFALNDDLLKQAGGGGYWKELLERIRDIRSSEKVFYRQILDIYATSTDYNPNAEETKLFFKVVQNKMHLRHMAILQQKSYIYEQTAQKIIWD